LPSLLFPPVRQALDLAPLHGDDVAVALTGLT
jgi:hypothetical protein